MKTRIALGALLALAIAAPAMAHTSVQIGIGLNVPPPVVEYRSEPRWVMMPHERVWVVDDDRLGYDYFRYGGWYWIYQNDHWFRARRYNGPYAVCRADYVPVAIWRLGDRDHYRWRHRPEHMAPGFARKYRRGDVPPGHARREEWREDRREDRRDDRRDDRSHGHDRGNR